MKKIREYLGLIILVLVVLIFAFWWYEWRPSHYVKACHLWSLDRTEAVSGYRKDVDYFLNKCLRENGIYYREYRSS